MGDQRSSMDLVSQPPLYPTMAHDATDHPMSHFNVK